jgi:hypothetical protein
VALDCRHVAGYWSGACRRHVMAKELHRRHAEYTLLPVDNKASILQPLEKLV